MMVDLLKEKLTAVLEDYLSPIISTSILSLAAKRAACTLDTLGDCEHDHLLKEIEKGVLLYASDDTSHRQCMDRVSQLVYEHSGREWSVFPGIRKIAIRNEDDILSAREAGREMCRSNGFRLAAQIKLMTVISELARNIVQYAGKGEVSLVPFNDSGRVGIEIVAEDHGPGIANVDDILAGHYRSKSGLGKGLSGTKNLADEFDIVTSPVSGTRVTLRMYVS